LRGGTGGGCAQHTRGRRSAAARSAHTVRHAPHRSVRGGEGVEGPCGCRHGRRPRRLQADKRRPAW
jgi:hypothetical protein